MTDFLIRVVLGLFVGFLIPPAFRVLGRAWRGEDFWKW